MNESPAPMVSTTSTRGASALTTTARVTTRAPAPPHVTSATAPSFVTILRATSTGGTQRPDAP
jgi:hypothetical protein